MGRVTAGMVAIGLLLGLGLGTQAEPADEPSQEQLQRELRQELSHEMDADDWFGTSMTLVLLGSDAYPVLMDALQDPNSTVRANAAEALSFVPSDEGSVPAEVRQALETALQDPDPRVQKQAQTTLEGLSSF